MYKTAYHNEDISKTKFLVTGGAGFIGSNIVEYLLKYNATEVVVLDNYSTGSKTGFQTDFDHRSRNDKCKKSLESDWR